MRSATSSLLVALLMSGALAAPLANNNRDITNIRLDTDYTTIQARADYTDPDPDHSPEVEKTFDLEQGDVDDSQHTIEDVTVERRYTEEDEDEEREYHRRGLEENEDDFELDRRGFEEEYEELERRAEEDEADDELEVARRAFEDNEDDFELERR